MLLVIAKIEQVLASMISVACLRVCARMQLPEAEVQEGVRAERPAVHARSVLGPSGARRAGPGRLHELHHQPGGLCVPTTVDILDYYCVARTSLTPQLPLGSV